MSEDFGCGMRLPATNPKFNGNIADVALHKMGESPHFLQWSFGRRSESSDLLRDLRRGIPAPLGQVQVPLTHLGPRTKAVVRGTARRKIGNCHLGGNAFYWRHLLFLADGLHIADDPLPVVSAVLSGFHVRVVDPRRLVLPPWWQ